MVIYFFTDSIKNVFVLILQRMNIKVFYPFILPKIARSLSQINTFKNIIEFASKSHQDIGKVFEPIISDDQDVQDDDEYDDDDEEEEEYDEAEAQYAEEFMREIIINKVKKEYPEKFGREPTEQELEDMVNATLSMFAGAIQEQDDEEYVVDDEDNDDEYDPNEDQHQAMNDELLDLPNDEELKTERQDIEEAMKEEAEPLKDVLDEEEEKLVNSEHFEKELVSAIEMVQDIAKVDKEKILTMTRELYKSETGTEPTNEMMDDALKLFTMNKNEDDIEMNDNDDIDQDNIDGEEFKKEMEMALENVRKLGNSHRDEFINQICKTYAELNGVEATEEQISGIFGRIKETLADEAREEFLEDNNDIDDDDDEVDKDDHDYIPNEEDVKQVEDDKKMDLLEEFLEDNDDMDDKEDDDDDNEDKVETKKVKILVTPVKKRLSGSRVDIYLQDQPDTNKVEKHLIY